MTDTSLAEAFAACGTVLLGLIVLVCLRYLFMVCFECIFFDRYYNDPPWLLRKFFPSFVQQQRNNNTNDANDRIYDEYIISEQQNDMISLSELILRVNHVLPNNNNDNNNTTTDQTITNDIIEQLLPGKLLTDESIIEIQKLVTKSSKSVTNKELQLQQQQQQPHDNNNIVQQDDHHVSDHSNSDNTTTTDNNNNNSPTGLPLCSICIHDVQVGEMIYIADLCHHIFHADCIRGWVAKTRQEQQQQQQQQQQHYPASHAAFSNNNNNNNNINIVPTTTTCTEIQINNDCPNCRSPILHDLKVQLRSIIRKYNEPFNETGTSTRTSTATTTAVANSTTTTTTSTTNEPLVDTTTTNSSTTGISSTTSSPLRSVSFAHDDTNHHPTSTTTGTSDVHDGVSIPQEP